MSKDLFEQIDKILNSYVDDIEKGFKKDLDDISKEALNQLKKKSPKDTGDYQRNWTKTKRKDAIILHNKKHRGEPSNITSLLEHSHLTRNGKRVRGQKHIEPVEQWAIKELIERTEKRIGK